MTTQKLEHNLRLYAWMKTFTKRVYFPVAAVMMVQNAHLSYEQVAFVGIVAIIANGLLQVPTGYVADAYGNRKTMLLGALVMFPSTLFFVFMPDFLGVTLGTLLYTGGAAFIGGASEALLYDTLVAMGRVKDYAKEVGRAQSIALMGNVLLVSTVPLTYALDFRLPFVIGFVCSALLFYVIWKMIDPALRLKITTKLSPLEAMQHIVTWQNVSLFLLAGLLGGMVDRLYDFLILSLKEASVPVYLNGIVAGISSLFGALLGWNIRWFDRLPPLVFYALDGAIITGGVALLGTQNMAVVVASFITILAYARVRYIVFQSKVLEDLRHAYKATLISALSFFAVFGGVLSMTVLGSWIKTFGFSNGLVAFAVTMGAITASLWLLIVWSRRRASDVPVETRRQSAQD